MALVDIDIRIIDIIYVSSHIMNIIHVVPFDIISYHNQSYIIGIQIINAGPAIPHSISPR